MQIFYKSHTHGCMQPSAPQVFDACAMADKGRGEGKTIDAQLAVEMLLECRDCRDWRDAVALSRLGKVHYENCRRCICPRCGGPPWRWLCEQCSAQHAARYAAELRDNTPGRRRLTCCICSTPCIEPIEPCGPWPGCLFCAEHHSQLSTMPNECLQEAVENERLRRLPGATLLELLRSVLTDEELLR